MTPLPVRPRRLRSVAASVALVAAATALLTVAPGPAPAQAAAQTYYASPGDNLAAMLTNLRPGDSLLLRPGVYDVGYLRPNITPGTPNAVISFGAADRAHPPLLRGLVKLFGPSYWVLSGLRVQATQPSFEALYMGGGTGWRVMNSEFFGARQTGAYDNVVRDNYIAGSGMAGFTIHAHLPGGEDVNGNKVVGNDFGTNNVGGDGFDGPPGPTNFATTAIAVYSAPTVEMTIRGNHIHDNAIGIWLSTTVTAHGLTTNHFHNVPTHVVTG